MQKRFLSLFFSTMYGVHHRTTNIQLTIFLKLHLVSMEINKLKYTVIKVPKILSTN